ncbi:hypothetical protein CEXT_441011 [Caerostris extrusa]|uniref:Uncharacterized protein n=1 Tax=Caerostris extrusa TaxID=172846 RepID=A0AAV4NFH8_CAEEX|nr:hypothetical protein CEXT_441011 [Caerostris extrusa]
MPSSATVAEVRCCYREEGSCFSQNCVFMGGGGGANALGGGLLSQRNSSQCQADVMNLCLRCDISMTVILFCLTFFFEVPDSFFCGGVKVRESSFSLDLFFPQVESFKSYWSGVWTYRQ